MWRLCDLHTHTVPNEQEDSEWDASAFVQGCIDLGLDVVAITDHDNSEHLEDAIGAAKGLSIELIPGVEISTDRGHVLALSPGTSGLDVIDRFIARMGVQRDGQVSFDEVVQVARSDFFQSLLLVGAHVDADGSLLATGNTLNLDGQIDRALRLDALEVEAADTLNVWLAGGVKQQSNLSLTLIRGSDRHDLGSGSGRLTWLYLPALTVDAFRHTFAVPESSIRFEEPDALPDTWIERVAFDGGFHDGLVIEFCERTNALIGPPNVGKTLVVDALKFVFDLESGIPEIDELAAARLAACLADGESVSVSIRTPDGSVELERTVGAATIPDSPLQPIVFSQTELVRRAHESVPAIELLDVHNPRTSERKLELHTLNGTTRSRFLELLEVADQARELAGLVQNPQDGLQATKEKLAELSGTEHVAKRSNDVARIEAWRDRLEENLDDWFSRATEPHTPDIPDKPTFETDDADLANQIPFDEIEEAIEEFRERRLATVTSLREAIQKGLDDRKEAFDLIKQETDRSLESEGFEGGSEALDEIKGLRTRSLELEEQALSLKELDRQLQEGIQELSDCIERIETARESLREERKATCRLVNDSMRSFAARLNLDAHTDQLDSLIEELKTGTWLGPEARARLRDDLDRKRVLERALLVKRNDLSSLEKEPEAESQDRVTDEAADRAKWEGLVDLACLWPGDGLELLYLDSPEPTMFQSLTEGLRALAIKEISFAASPVPVITDQPEDAVPTRAVFENLVPTLRKQRAARQFVVVSHDANIVVAGDIDRVLVLSHPERASLVAGSLFDRTIREAALEHLEGGEEAFRLRSRRYAGL